MEIDLDGEGLFETSALGVGNSIVSQGNGQRINVQRPE
jgi:hypothetical protein